MFEYMRKKVVAEEELKPNVRSLEGINDQIENSTNPAEKAESLRKAEKIEAELDKIEKLMGISADEIMSFYETMTPEDAKDVVSKTIEKIPLSIMRGVLFTVDNLNKNGGKIMLWASMRSPREAALVAASVMILLAGDGLVQEASADESVPIAITYESEARPASESVVTLEGSNAKDDFLKDLNVVQTDGNATGAHNGLVQMNPDGKLEHMQTTDGGYADQKNKHNVNPDVKVNGNAAYEIGRDGDRKIYGNENSINEENIKMGTITY